MADLDGFEDEGTLVLEQRFAIVPEWIIDARISDCAFRLYAVLLRYGQTSGQRMPGRAVPARQRPRLRPARSARVFLRLSIDEQEDLVVSAGRAGLTPTGFAAQAALAAARGQEPPAAVLLREPLAEVMTARTQVRRFATNVNQAVAALHSSGSRRSGSARPSS